MRRRKKDREEKIDVRGIIAILFVIVLTIRIILFIMTAPATLNKYDVVNNKLETMDKYSNNNDLLSNNNKKDDLLNLIRDFITYRRHIRFAWMPESLFFRVTIMFFLSFVSALFSILVINKIKKEGFEKKDLKMYFILLLWIGIIIFAFLMLKDNIITYKEYLSIAVGIILALLLTKN